MRSLSTKLRSSPLQSTSKKTTLPSIIVVSKRYAGPGTEAHHPKDGTYRNLFNKWVSRDGKRVYFSSYVHDFNEPWPFPPTYDKEGNDWNYDDIWGMDRWNNKKWDGPPSSITGKPRRALGHYPWLGRSIVPYDDNHFHFVDDFHAPQVLFRTGRFTDNKQAYKHWIWLFGFFFGGYYLFDCVLAYRYTFKAQRDDLFYRECYRTDYGWVPVATQYFANPDMPIKYTWAWQAPGAHTRSEVRNREVWIPLAKEEAYANMNFHTFNYDGELPSNKALWKQSEKDYAYMPEWDSPWRRYINERDGTSYGDGHGQSHHDDHHESHHESNTHDTHGEHH